MSEEARVLFQAKIEKFLEKVSPERRGEAASAVEGMLLRAPAGSPAEIGKVVGPYLKKLELEYVPREPSLSKEEKLRALHAVGAVDDVRLAEILHLLGEPGVGKAIEGAYGHLVSTSKDAPHVIAYTQMEGFMFERSRAAIARRWWTVANEWKGQPGKPVKVDFLGLRLAALGAPASAAPMNAVIDNDVPVIPDVIWETKRYTRMDYGTTASAYNQLFKYQAAIDHGHFKRATLEIHGNIAPTFLQALIDMEPVVPGLVLEIPDVEVLYALDADTAIQLRRSRQDGWSLVRNASSPELQRGIIRALAKKNYELFSGRILAFEDVAGDMSLVAAMRFGRVEPTEIQDPHVFRRFEQLVWKKRQKVLRDT